MGSQDLKFRREAGANERAVGMIHTMASAQDFPLESQWLPTTSLPCISKWCWESLYLLVSSGSPRAGQSISPSVLPGSEHWARAPTSWKRRVNISQGKRIIEHHYLLSSGMKGGKHTG